MDKDFVNLIIEKSLSYLTFDKMCQKISEVADTTETEAREYVSSLLKDGTLMKDQNDRIFVTASRGYIKCKICANKKGYAFAEIIDNPENKSDIFIPKDLLMGALDEDIVLVEITNSVGSDSEGRVVKILEHNTEYVVGELKLIGGKYYLEPDDEKFPTIRINSADRLRANEGDKVVAKVEYNEDLRLFKGIVTECLGRAGLVSVEEAGIIKQSKIRDHFPDQVLKEASAVPDEVAESELKDRLDLRGERIITIDGEDSRDFDDAISISKTDKGYSVGVHIADVSHYVKEGSALDHEAFLRGCSCYFPDLVIPMLPEKLSNGICSLREGVDRLTLSVLIELDNDAKVISSKVANSVIRSAHRMTYTKVQAMLNGDKDMIKEYKDIYEDVLLYREVSMKLKKLREARGEIRLDIPEPQVFEKSNGEIDHIEKAVQDESHELIESLMILANECIASTYFKKKLPFIYRVHEKPEPDKVNKLVNVFSGLGINANMDPNDATFFDYQRLAKVIENDDRRWTLMKIILRSMMKARYSDKCLGHFGIASEFYCHFTSPIRRYPDLMIHRIIKAYLNGAKPKDLQAKFGEIVSQASEQSSITEKRADDVERAVDDYKKALYMKKHLGEKYTGIISGVHNFGIFVELDNTIEGLIRFEYLPVDQYDYDDQTQILKGIKHCYKLGDKLDVVCVNANTRLRQIDFDLAEKLNKASIEEIISERQRFLNNYSKNQDKAKSEKKSSNKLKSKKGKLKGSDLKTKKSKAEKSKSNKGLAKPKNSNKRSSHILHIRVSKKSKKR